MRTLTLIAAVLCALGVIHVYDGTALLNTPYYLIDFFFVGDVAWRAYLGQVPHLDVHTPIGQAYFWPYALTTALAGPTTGAILAASALVGVVAGFLSWALLRHNAPPWTIVAVALLAFGCAVTPRWMDMLSPSHFSHLAPYNSWGWGLLVPLSLFAFLPRKDRRESLAQGALFGAATAFLLLMKVTYGLAAIGFLALAVITGQRKLSTAGTAGAACVLLIGLVGVWQGNLSAYLADLRLAILASDEGLIERLRQRRLIAYLAFGHGLAAAVLLLLGVRAEIRSMDAPAIIIRLWRPAMFCAAILAVGFGLAVQNHPKVDVPLFAAVVLLAYFWSSPVLAARRGPWRGLPAVPAVALVAAALVYTTGRDLAAVMLHRAEATWGSVVQVPEFKGTILAGLRVPQAVLEDATSEPQLDPANCRKSYDAAQQLRAALDGLAVLQESVPAPATVLALDFVNPFPAIWNASAPVGGLLWYDPGRTFSREHRPAAKDALGSVDVVLRGVDCAREGYGLELLWEAFGEDIERDFVLFAETPIWRVYVRKLHASAPPSH